MREIELILPSGWADIDLRASLRDSRLARIEDRDRHGDGEDERGVVGGRKSAYTRSSFEIGDPLRSGKPDIRVSNCQIGVRCR